MRKIFPKKIGGFLTCLTLLLGISGSLSAQISGSVFRDYNANGVQDAADPVVAGVIVTAYSGGSSCGTAITTSASSPNYTLTGCTGDVRVEFTIPSEVANVCGISSKFEFSAYNGGAYGSSVQFTTGSGTANFAIGNPSQYASPTLTNPKLFTSCYVSGDNLGAGNVGDADAFVSVDYNPTGNATPAPGHYANTRQIGSTWGVAFSKQSKKIFTSAVLKRHTGLGPLGSGGIYMIDPSIQLPDLTGVTNFLDFDAIGIPTRGTGTYAGETSPTPLVAFSDVIGTNTERNLGANLNTGERDAQAVAQAARVSFGDLDISDDGRYLYVMNLYDRKLYQIDLTDPLNPVAPTAANRATKIKSWVIPEPCTAGTGVARPWSIDFYRGEPYIGVVCDASVTEVSSDLSFTIYSLDITSGTFSPKFTSALDFPRGIANGFQSDGASRTGWFGWTDDWDKLTGGNVGSSVGVTWPQPILSDLEFDTDGSLIMGFMDRTGLQGGWNNFGPVDGDNSLHLTIVGGDLLRAYKRPSDCEWELESAGKEGPSSPKAATGGATNGEGPGGGEFYYEEAFAAQHRETALGGVGILFGSGQVVATIMDPFRYDSFGLGWFNNTTGQKDKGFEVFFTNNNFQTPSSGTFSKGLSLGDIEVEEELPPIEIGNRVWKDTDLDGVQDGDEAGIDGVEIELYEGTTATGSPVATATTANGGQWYFNNTNVTGGLKPQTDYVVKLKTALDSGPLTGYTAFSPQNATTGGEQDMGDSDASPAGTIAYKTGNFGENNHTLDIGLTEAPACVPPTATASAANATCSNGTANSNASITVAAFTAGQRYRYSTGGTFTAGSAVPAAITAIPAGGVIVNNLANGATTYTVRIYDATDDACFEDRVVSTTLVNCAIPCNAPTPTGVAAERCGEGTVTLTASGCSAAFPAVWYSDAALATQVGTGNSFTTPSLTATTDYYVACVETATPTCKSAGVLVKATIKPNPTITAATPVCNEGGTAFEVGYTATALSVITADKGTLDTPNSKFTAIPSGETITITATLIGCAATATATATCAIPCPLPNCGTVTVIKN